MAVIGYARVSTHGQNLDAQLEALHKEGCDEIFQEKASGAKQHRPELAAMLRYARKGDIVVATKLDRLARSTKHLLQIVDELQSKDVELKIINLNLDTSTPTGKLMLTMLAGIAQFEREIMLERQREGFEVAKSKGKIKGRPTSAQDKAEQIVKLAGCGLTKQAIADKLQLGVASVYNILRDHRGQQ